MKRFIQKRAGFHKIAVLTLTGATLAAPMLSVTARADQYGIGSGATVDDGGIGSGATYNGNNNNGGIGSGATYNGGGIGTGATVKGGTRITAYGYVTSGVSNNTFQMRRDNGDYVQVKYKGFTPQGLQRGSRISLTGRLTNDGVVHNASITVIKSGPDKGTNITANGIVTSDINYSTFQLHRDNGSYVQVKFKGYTPAGLRRGSRITLTGRLTNDNVVHDANIRVINNGNGNNNNGAATADFMATVSSTQSLRLMTVRRDNGLLYNVRSNFNSDTRISSGDRVHIVGTIYSGSLTVYATRIELLNDYNNNNGNGNYGYNNGDNVDIRGIVRSSQKQLFIGRVLTVDGDNGNTYEVRTSDDTLTRGTLVRVRGTLTNGFVTNARIDRL